MLYIYLQNAIYSVYNEIVSDKSKKWIRTKVNFKSNLHRQKGDSLVRVEELIEDIKSTFSMEDSDIDMRLIYNYSQLNAYGKMIMDKSVRAKVDGGMI